MNTASLPQTCSRLERVLGVACLALLLLACLPIDPYSLIPALPPAHMPAFADARGWMGIPNAMDVLSNLPFALIGLAGLCQLAMPRQSSLPPATRRGLLVFHSGLVLTAGASAFYHWQPDAALGLALDRAAMAFTFAGMLALAACDRVSQRAGAAMGLFAMVGGLLAVAVWYRTTTVWPWAVVQFGGMVMVVALALLPRAEGGIGIRLWMVVAVYAMAKLLELTDHSVLELTSGLISGHSLKHIVASLAGLWVLHAVHGYRPMTGRCTLAQVPLRHNPRTHFQNNASA